MIHPLSTLNWTQRAEAAQHTLRERFWNPTQHVMNQRFPCEGGCNEPYIYWWHAHTLDVLVDALLRTGDSRYTSTLREAFEGARTLNGGTLLHNWYDDMQWMALALLRAFEATGEPAYLDGVRDLWADIQGGWNDHCGGGIAWKKDQPDYKNTPANAPAAILAARLYRRFGKDADLAWARRIYAWTREHLVDPVSGFVWDGMNRLGDGQLEDGWHFTYNQGAYLGAGLALHRATGETAYLDDAIRTAEAARARLSDPTSGVLPDEGDGDGGLFKGIFVRYLTLLIREQARPEWTALLHRNGNALVQNGIDPDTGLYALRWDRPPPRPTSDHPVSLSGQLSGVMVFEALATLERRNLLS
ncbi:putative alpha-1,6-mannanase (GH76 family) [Deinococcus metalli]|uniref:Glycoside hydrolase n=1 Tax=Deinococcus metalli TaxID=1141878 RepID=A0A7W8KE61_9DEIO|nr:glycoside hydrolase family 76 protein [Deinococcus metalli]MBB5376525.1 putative alpha-1,6-mannanase (GH76 family) [Deinococcus metalli]GHF43373.1 glycoside hydrolase [Deinococcus metalli]